MHANFEGAVSAMTRVGRTFEPIPENHRIYDALYRRVYRRMYAQLRPLYEEIRSITGYPQ
jgi:sugar (pentulose or hexulose) kinase